MFFNISWNIFHSGILRVVSSDVHSELLGKFIGSFV